MEAQHTAPRRASRSWLSLIAETSDSVSSHVARVELTGHGHGPLSVIVQIVAHDGRVLGAERWTGAAEDLQEGVLMDVGAWISEDDARDARAVAFYDDTDGLLEPELLRDPSGAPGTRLARSVTRLDLDLIAARHGHAA
ncbi:MAG: hypothetical protein B6A08_14110 [Sorangiineae bacterium NIC37A_2]|jgi:hypothetical protein|nr:MAG: hypothetical protein B6A08_14110 [Sorangiineae bacterium NIC37A_2]